MTNTPIENASKRPRWRSLWTALIAALATQIGVSNAVAQDPPLIIWVSFNDDQNEAAAADAADQGYVKASDAPYTEALKAAGAEVVRHLTAQVTPDAAFLNTADLIIVSRSVNSPHYQDALATDWNTTITKPVIFMSGYIIRNSRLGLMSGATIPDTTDVISLHADDPSHPVWNGIALDGSNNMETPFAGIVEFNGVTQRGISVVTDPVGGSGVVLGSVAAGSAPEGGTIIAEWPAGTTVTHDAGPVTDTLASDRMIFLSGSREADGFVVATAGHYDLEAAGEQLFFNAVNYMAGSNLVPPPRIGNISPASGATFADASAGFSFTATSVEDIPTDGITVSVNGVDVTSSLQIGGSATAREVSYDNIDTGEFYSVEITVTNVTGARTVTTNFDTFSADLFTIEAEDFNFEGGGYFDDPILCNPIGGMDNCYFDKVSVLGIDANEIGGFDDEAGNVDNWYRYGSVTSISREEAVDTTATSDVLRPKFANADPNPDPIRDYEVNQIAAGDWLNYTRTFEEDVYRVLVRASASAEQTVSLGRVSNPASENQTVESLGTFNLSGASGYGYTPLTDASGNTELILSLSGLETLRLTANDAANNLQLNFLLFVPADVQEVPPVVTAFSPENGATRVALDASITATINDGTVAVDPASVSLTVNGTEAAADVNKSGSSTSVSYTPAEPFGNLETVSVSLSFADVNGEAHSLDWSFETVSEAGQGKNGANIVWVSFHADDDEPDADAAGAGFTRAPDVGYTEFLESAGYSVTRYVTSNSPDPAVLNAADLVIVSRSVNSGDYSGDGATAWNGISAPMIITGGYTLRSSRMGFTTGGTMLDTAMPATLSVNDPSHPIFAGIQLDGDGMTVNPYAGIEEFNGTTQRGVSVNTDAINAEGTMLATTTVGDPAVDGMAIGEWQAGATLTHDGGAGTDTLAGHRLIFLTGSREHDGLTSHGSGIYDLEPDGAKMFLNAVRYMLNPNPINVTFVSFHPADDAPAANAAAAGFAEASDKGYTDLLSANGFNVTRYQTTATPDIELLNGSDLVIISRAVPSGNYQNAAATQWNSVQAPMLVLGGYVLRNSRMGFTTGGDMPDTENPISLNVNDPSHPIFLGVELDANNTMVNTYANIVEFDGTTQRGVSVNNNSPVEGGTVLATVGSPDFDPTINGMVVGEWRTGTTMSNGTADVLAGPRVVLLTGSREHDGLTSEGAGIYDLTEDGAELFLNAVRYTAGLRAPVVIPSGGVFDDIALNADGTVTISWTGGSIESTPSLTNPDWQPVNGASPLTVTPDGDRFYRIAE